MKFLSCLLLLALSLNVARAQRTETKRDTLRQRDGESGGLEFNEPSSVGSTQPTVSQSGIPGIRYGAYGDVNFNGYNADFRKLPGVPNCCSRFTEGSGTASAFGFLDEFPVSNDMVFGLRAGYAAMNATFRASEFSVILANGSSVPALFEHTIEARPATVGLTPMIGYHVTEKLMAHAGTEVGFMVGRDYHQYEKMVEPYSGTFSNGTRTRNDYSGSLPDAQPIQAALVFGTSYDIPVNSSGSIIAAPEAFYTVGLTTMVKGLSWHNNSARLGLSVKYAPDMVLPAAEPAPTPLADVKPAKLQTPVETKPVTAAVTAMGLREDGTELPLSSLKVEDVISTSTRPMLNYLFFDENSASIPARYAQITPAQAKGFSIDNLSKLQTLPTYYQTLNVIGRRLQERPQATITLIGNNADLGAERGNRSLSERRATAVRDYLRDVWHIEPNRMQIESRNLPQNPSNASDPDGIAENRRVEILSSNPEITQPITTTDTLRRPAVQAVRFKTNTQAEAGVAEWTLVASQDGKPLRRFNGTGQVPESLDWNVDADGGSTLHPGKIDYTLEVKDPSGRTTTTPVASIPVEHSRTVAQQKDEYRKLDRFSLMLFDYNRAQLNDANRRVIETIKKKIIPDATVSVTGYTDRIGDAEYNRKLSTERAKLTASALNVPNARVSGMGESAPQFTNDLPEGRFYNRTVDVVVETPVK
jgi:outer membrane protein OmpA-like peptidoglycan-associated protein